MDDRGEIIIYQTEDGLTKIDVSMQDETVWLTQEQMAELFQRDKSTISRHIKNIFAEGELDEKVVVAEFATILQNFIIWMLSSPLVIVSNPSVVYSSVYGRQTF